MRVLFVTSWYPSTEQVYLGAFVREQAMAVARRHDIRVLAPRLTRLPGRSLRPMESLSKDEPMASRPAATFTVPRRVSWTSAANAFTGATRRVLTEWQAEGWSPQVIHGHTLLPAGWTALQLGRELGVPTVVTVHSSFVSQPVLTRSSEQRVRRTITEVDALVAVGPTVVEELTGIEPGCKPRLIPNLVDDAFFSPSLGKAAWTRDHVLRVVGVGALIPAKRYHLLLAAVSQLHAAGTGIELTLVGDGPERQRLEREAGRLGIGTIVRFTGGLDRTGVRDELRKSDLLVHPSRYETFGVVLVEAMACGVPVIATRSGGPDWVVEPETGQLVDVDDPEALSAAMGRFATGKLRNDPATVRARAVARFGSDRVLDQLDALYRELAAGA